MMPSRGRLQLSMDTSHLPTTPSKAQQQWMELGYGLFIHFGPDTFTAAGWGDGKFQKLSEDIASTAYWYQVEPHAPFPALPSLGKRRPWTNPK